MNSHRLDKVANWTFGLIIVVLVLLVIAMACSCAKKETFGDPVKITQLDQVINGVDHIGTLVSINFIVLVVIIFVVITIENKIRKLNNRVEIMIQENHRKHFRNEIYETIDKH